MPTKAPRLATSYRFAPDVATAIEAGANHHGHNRTAYLEHLVRAAAGPTITLVGVPGESGLWVPATPADWGVHRRLCQPRPGDRSDQEGLVGRLVARAAEEGITVVFRPGEPGQDR